MSHTMKLHTTSALEILQKGFLSSIMSPLIQSNKETSFIRMIFIISANSSSQTADSSPSLMNSLQKSKSSASCSRNYTNHRMKDRKEEEFQLSQAGMQNELLLNTMAMSNGKEKTHTFYRFSGKLKFDYKSTYLLISILYFLPSIYIFLLISL